MTGPGESDIWDTRPVSSAAIAGCPVEWAGQSLLLLPDRALWWPSGGVLFIADLHLGKAATYRALGQPVPGGTTQENLERLDGLIARLAPARLSWLPRTSVIAMSAWRTRHASTIGKTLRAGAACSRSPRNTMRAGACCAMRSVRRARFSCVVPPGTGWPSAR